MDQELIAYFDERFRESSRQIGELREETVRRFERVDEAIRHTQIMVEGVRSDIQGVAEGVLGLDERIGTLKSDLTREIKEIRNFVHLSHEEMRDRMRPLEEWKNRIGEDPVALVRQKFGRKT
jgi:archaellum component FlaC